MPRPRIASTETAMKMVQAISMAMLMMAALVEVVSMALAMKMMCVAGFAAPSDRALVQQIAASEELRSKRGSHQSFPVKGFDARKEATRASLYSSSLHKIFFSKHR